MTTPRTLEQLVDDVMTFARVATRRQAVELGVIHGLCIDFAESSAPSLVEMLSNVRGLHALVNALELRPDLAMAIGPDKARWHVIRQPAQGIH